MTPPTMAPASPRWLGLVAAHLRRDWLTAWSYRLPFVTGLFGSLISLLVYYFIAKLVDRSEFREIPELSQGYFAFVMLGSSLVAIMNTGLTANAARLQRAQATGTLEAMAATPAPLWLTTFLGSLYELMYATASGVVTVALGVAFFGVRLDVQPAGIPLIVVGLVATFALFASIGMVIAAFGLVFKKTGPLLTLVNTGLAFLGGVFFPIDVLPGPIRFIAELMPFTWAVDLIRLTLLAGALPIQRLVGLCVCAVVVFPLAVLLFERSVTHTRRVGTLGQY